MENPLEPEIVGQIRQLGGDELLADLVEIFLKQAPVRLQELRDGIAQNDLERAGKAAHSFRSSSVSLGARAIGEEAVDLELLADAGAADELRRRLPEFEASLETLVSFLNSEFSGSH